MSLTSYRAAPPRVKPFYAPSRAGPETNRPTRRRRPKRPKGFLRRQPGHRQRVRGVCINASLLWKGPKRAVELFVTPKTLFCAGNDVVEPALPETAQKRSLLPEKQGGGTRVTYT